MELVIQSLKERTKKYYLILFALTIFLGVIGWLIPIGKEASRYTAEATITLGNYDNPDLNDPKRVIVLLTNAPFYRENLPNLWEEKQEQISTNLHITALTDNMINLSYTDHPRESSIEIIDEITNAFLAVDRESFQQKKKIIQDSIDALKNKKVGPEAMVDQQRFLYELKTAKNDIKSASILKSADNESIDTEDKAFDSKERAVLGVLMGLTLSFFWIVIPELVRDRSH